MRWPGGARLRKLRRLTGLDMTEVARFVGVPYDTWANWERGNYAPTEENRKRILRALSNFLGRRVRWEEVEP